MERNEVIISEGNGLQSARALTRCIQAVCYIEAILTDKKSGKQRLKRGSGFYAKLNVKGSEFYGVFTNNHVLASTIEAESAWATFGYEGSNEGKKVKLRPDLIFRTHKDLDYSFAGVRQQDVQDLQLDILPISIESEPEVQKGDQIFVFQHPKGRPKEFSQEKILRVERPFVYYKADTETGSSGSPVFTTIGLKLIAIHHKGSEELSYNKGTLCSEILSHLNSGTYTQLTGVYSDSQDKEIYEDGNPAKKIKLDQSSCTKVPSEEDLEQLCQDIVGFWKHLGRRLKVPRAKLDEITSDNVQYPGVKEKAFQMLLAWLDMGEEATFSELSRALKGLGNCRLANKFCGHVS